MGIPVSSQTEAGEINSLEQQARAGYSGAPKPAMAPKNHQARATAHRDGMTYGERGDVAGKKSAPARAVATVLRAFPMRPR